MFKTALKQHAIAALLACDHSAYKPCSATRSYRKRWAHS